VVLADDQSMVRAGFRMILDSEPDIDVVGEAEDGEWAITEARSSRPDIVLMDIQMPVLGGIEATRRLLATPTETGPKVLILTTFERDEYIFQALRAGASGFLLKNAPPEDLIDAVRIVAEGDSLLAPSITRRVIEDYVSHPRARRPAAELESLTERELDVLRLLARGMSNAEVAGRLVLGEATVKTHVSNLLGKLELRDRVQAVVFAYESGLVEPGEA
jgi:DNA-binding NarL/FixJ family response regulator